MIKKILLIRFSSYGDVILLHPVVEKLHKAGYEVHILTKKTYRDIFQYNPHVRHLLFLEEHPHLIHLVQEIRKNRYFKVLDLHRNLRTFFIKLFLPGRVLSYKKFRFRRFLLLRFRINLLKRNRVVRNYLDPLKKLGIRINKHDEGYALIMNEKSMSRRPFLLMKKKRYITLAPFAKYFTKEWVYYRELVRELGRKHQIVMIGEKKDFSRAGEFKNTLNLCGKLDFNEMACLISRSRLFVCNDSGLMHLAAGTGTPIIVLLGSTVREFGFLPERKNVLVLERKGLECRPCHYHGLAHCPLGHFRCMREISLKEVLYHVHKSFGID